MHFCSRSMRRRFCPTVRMGDFGLGGGADRRTMQTSALFAIRRHQGGSVSDSNAEMDIPLCKCGHRWRQHEMSRLSARKKESIRSSHGSRPNSPDLGAGELVRPRARSICAHLPAFPRRRSVSFSRVSGRFECPPPSKSRAAPRSGALQPWVNPPTAIRRAPAFWPTTSGIARPGLGADPHFPLPQATH
jgi:hypothetical protein